MRLTAHAKINWALNVLGRRADGYHELDMLVQRVALADSLEFEPDDGLRLEVAGSDAPTDGRNLAYRAAAALRAACGVQAGALIRLTKRIPSQAGLGGGSADAAATLQGLNALWGCGLDQQQLAGIGLGLGADVPLCLQPGLMRAQGIGEHLSPLPGGRALDLVIVQPLEGLSTPAVFQAFALHKPERMADIQAGMALLQAGGGMDFGPLFNQLQPAAQALLPVIDTAQQALLANGAVFAQMSGSGSAVYGVFENARKAGQAQAALAADWPVCIQTKTIES
ncbi:MAG: 4-(cytidine 5'-diphospho)-2-C-methyl-D-erythritol kinase [Clostridiales bacterium]|nr:4-(cytidine 5'-diphospho)-2-C-methyl-D-erythritol kinase [Clostridiales bacterium]